MTKPYALSFELLSPGRIDGTLVLPQGGRILTVPEITEIRRRYHPLDQRYANPWNRPFLTGSREYRGLSPAGNDVLVIHHPMAGTQEPDHATFDAQAFRSVLGGQYGEVSVFDFGDIMGPGAKSKARRRLSQARLGGGDLEAALAKQFERQVGSSPETFRITFQAAHGGHSPIGNQTTSRSLWLAPLLMRDAVSPAEMNLKGPWFDLLVSYEEQRKNAKNRTCIAFHQGDATPVDIAPAVASLDVLRDEQRRGWREDLAMKDGIQQLEEFDGDLMTMTKGKRGRWPGFKVRSFERIGGLRPLNTGDSLDQALRSIPAGANAFVVRGVSSPTIEFGRADIDTSIRMPDAREFEDALFPGSELAAYHAERWWRAKQAREAA